VLNNNNNNNSGYNNMLLGNYSVLISSRGEGRKGKKGRERGFLQFQRRKTKCVSFI